MDLASMHWEQLPTVLATIALVLGATVGLLLVALPRREAWVAVGVDPSQHRHGPLREAHPSRPARRPLRELGVHPVPG